MGRLRPEVQRPLTLYSQPPLIRTLRGGIGSVRINGVSEGHVVKVKKPLLLEQNIKEIKDQWRVQGRGPGGPPPLFLDQTEARRAKKSFWRPPSLI